MDISSKLWRIFRDHNIPGVTFIENRTIKQSRIVKNVNEHEVSHCHERIFDRKCAEAFTSGQWPN